MIENPDLTDKQRLFCLYYIRCFNATKAYKKAYECSYDTAVTNGPALLGNTRIRNEIQNMKQNRLNREMLDENDIFQKYMECCTTKQKAARKLIDTVATNSLHPKIKNKHE